MKRLSGTHIAELNIGRFLQPLDDPRMAGFRDNLERINALAERMPGFVWRLQGASGNATDIAWVGGPNVAVNLSVWETAEALERFTFGTLHKSFYARRAEWFSVLDAHHFVMWEVVPGTRPTLEESAARLAHREAHGDSDRAFGWGYLSGAGLWRSGACGTVAAE